jgi:hypothetical protein
MCWRRMHKIIWIDRVINVSNTWSQVGEEYPTYNKMEED